MAKDYASMKWDYVTFTIFIIFSVLAPLWSELFGKMKIAGKSDYVFASGAVSIAAVMLSIARGTLGIRSVLGFPSELFYRGSAMWETLYGMVNAYPIVCYVFVPVYFSLGITSVYQYLDLRFNSRLVRCLASGMYAIRQILINGITVYTPSVALSAVIGIPYWLSIIGISALCIFFTLMGGLKAAIHADCIQTVSIAIITVAIIVKGTFFTGGPAEVFEINRDDGRLNFFTFTGDMTVRVDTFSAWIGQLFVSMSQIGCQQNFMQRYVSLKSLSDVKRAMLSNIPIVIFFFSLAWVAGMVIYSTYYTCDPLKEGYIMKQDEILPFYVADQMAFLPGFMGIFMATLFNGALCVNVSNANSLATVIWEDFVSQMPQFKGYTDKQQLSVIKVLTVIIGFVVAFAAFGVGFLSGLFESSMLALSSTSGPLLGVFMLAMLVPMANWKGAATGMITASALVLWIVCGGLTLDKSNDYLPTSVEGCDNFTFSSEVSKISWLQRNEPMLVNSSDVIPKPEIEKNFLQSIYAISFLFYSLLGTILTVFIGIIVSYLTRDDKKDRYDGKLLHPVIFKWCEHFPGPKPYFIKDSMQVGPSTVTTSPPENDKKSEKINAPKTKASGNVGDGLDIRSSSKDKNLELEVKFDNPLYGNNEIVGLDSKMIEPKEMSKSNQLSEGTRIDLNSGTYRKLNANDLV